MRHPILLVAMLATARCRQAAPDRPPGEEQCYVALARLYDRPEGFKGPTEIGDLAETLCSWKKWDVLRAVERVTRHRRAVLVEAVIRHDDDPGARELLAAWAQAHPEEIVLAPYRPGGAAYLVSVLEDVSAHPSRRARAALTLARLKDEAFVAVLERYTEDPTPVPQRSARAGDGPVTLGDLAKLALARLRADLDER